MTGGTAELRLRETLQRARTLERRGRVVRAFGTTVHASGLDVRIGQSCEIIDPLSGASIHARGAAVVDAVMPLVLL